MAGGRGASRASSPANAGGRQRRAASRLKTSLLLLERLVDQSALAARPCYCHLGEKDHLGRIGVMRCGPSGGAAAGGGALTALPGGGRTLDHPDRRAARPLASDGQGLLLRPQRRECPGGEGPLPGGVPRLRRSHPGAQWQGRRLRVLQGMPSRRDRAPMDTGARARRDARLAGAPRPPPVGLRLVAHPTPAAAAGKRSRGSTMATGRRQASSPTCTGAGTPRAQPHAAGSHERDRAIARGGRTQCCDAAPGASGRCLCGSR